MLRVFRDEAGNIELQALPPICADTLIRVPDLIGSDDPRVRSRLLPRVYDEDDEEEQWRRYATPELEHLFRSREEIVQKDLATLEQDSALTFRLVIAGQHLPAWIAALNAARLALFELNELRPQDMESDLPEVEGDGRQLALFRIHNLALIQELLMRAKRRSEPGEVPLDDDPSEGAGGAEADDDLPF
jgi:hypothetical protein